MNSIEWVFSSLLVAAYLANARQTCSVSSPLPFCTPVSGSVIPIFTTSAEAGNAYANKNRAVSPAHGRGSDLIDVVPPADTCVLFSPESKLQGRGHPVTTRSFIVLYGLA